MAVTSLSVAGVPGPATGGFKGIIAAIIKQGQGIYFLRTIGKLMNN